MDNPMMPALIAFSPFFAVLLFCAMRRGKPCPDCGAPLPSLQSPLTKTARQWIEGGYLCPRCGCEADIAGEKVPAGTAPRFSSLAIGVVLLTLAAVPAVVLFTLLLQR